MIQFDHVNLLRDDKTVLKDIQLSINTGEVVVLTGESGSGKSSLISLLNGLIPELYEGEVVGDATVLETSLPPLDFNQYVKDIGVVFQNPKTQFFTTSVFSELAFSMENYGISPDNIKERMAEVVEIFDLDELMGKKVTELSGGQKQRIAFASACMLPHRLFLFDEPSSNLDYQTIKQISSYLSLLKEQGCTLVIAEHRLFYLTQLADRYIVLKQGEICYNLPSADFHSLFPTIQKEMGLRTLNEPTELWLKKDSVKEENHSSELHIEHLNFHYKQSKTILHINELFIDTSKVIGLIGENGSGKTTFVQLLTGLLSDHDKKSVFLLNGTPLSAKERLNRSFLVMQDVNLQLFFETVEKELLVQSKRKELFDEVVEELNLVHLLQSHPQNLSGGEKQRVAIASAILSGKDWIILDEPTSGLDYRHMVAVSRLLRKVQSYGLFVLVISHDNEFLAKTTSQILRMQEGKIVS
ncbi:ABC transporter ATP-binding protein [Vagococcus bubulae]|uniref:ABC transporter domain-containing protein n=1 Tax=Vagococcus bubulae TaxID=1977868 RepID=A0A429ZE10_9ENTE|nr:ABC transporter ATP-binding protein [Vagococcus bubulae]RST91928.1 hypothetical protein CBF36_09400 [Vagococcus bubulae]